MKYIAHCAICGHHLNVPIGEQHCYCPVCDKEVPVIKKSTMRFLKPNDKNSYLIVCEHCRAIVNFSKDDLFCTKEIDMAELSRGNLCNVTKVSLKCPNCGNAQDVAAGFRYVSGDKNWF